MISESLKTHFEYALNLPSDASSWLVDIFEITQFLDDVVDGDEIERKDANSAIWKILVSAPTNQFFLNNYVLLTPVVANAIMKWQASDAVERDGFADERSYMWRAGFYDVILSVVQICHGATKAIELAPKVMTMYGESYESYKKEFPDG